MEIHRSLIDLPHKGLLQSFDVFRVACYDNLLDTQ